MTREELLSLVVGLLWSAGGWIASNWQVVLAIGFALAALSALFTIKEGIDALIHNSSLIANRMRDDASPGTDVVSALDDIRSDLQDIRSELQELNTKE
jgi:cell shape-determining protein MreC